MYSFAWKDGSKAVDGRINDDDNNDPNNNNHHPNNNNIESTHLHGKDGSKAVDGGINDVNSMRKTTGDDQGENLRERND